MCGYVHVVHAVPTVHSLIFQVRGKYFSFCFLIYNSQPLNGAIADVNCCVVAIVLVVVYCSCQYYLSCYCMFGCCLFVANI